MCDGPMMVPVERQIPEGCVGAAAENDRYRSLVDEVVVVGERETPEELVVCRCVPVDADVRLVGVRRLVAVADIVAGDAGDATVGKGIQRGVAEDRRGDRADAGRRDLVASERDACPRIPHGAEARKVAAAPGFGRH